MNKIKVLYIAHESGGSGASIALDNIISGIKDKVEVMVLFPNNGGKLYQKCVSLGLNTFCFPYTLFVYPSKSMKWYKIFPYFLYTLVSNLIAVYKLSNIVRVYKPDIIHTNVGPLKIGYIVAKKFAIPHVWHIRESLNLDFNMSPIPTFKSYTRLYKDANSKCVAITDFILNHFNLQDNGIRIYDGVLSSKESQCVQKKDYFLFVGRLEESKGDLVLLEQYSEYVKRGGKFKLKYVGTGVDERVLFLKNKIKEYGLSGYVELLGFRQDVDSFMSEAKAMFVPSLFEGFGFITVEAMYNHCLVVGRNTGGTKEQFDNGKKMLGKEIGIRFNEDNELPAIMTNIENYSYEDTIANAYSVVRQLYTKESNVNNLVELYDTIIKNKI